MKVFEEVNGTAPIEVIGTENSKDDREFFCVLKFRSRRVDAEYHFASFGDVLWEGKNPCITGVNNGAVQKSNPCGRTQDVWHGLRYSPF